MFVKITRSGPRSYVKLVEAFRDEAGVPRRRVVATLGRLEQIRAGGAHALVQGLLRVSGEDQKQQSCASPEPAPAPVRFAPRAQRGRHLAAALSVAAPGV